MSDCDPIRELLLDAAPLDAESVIHVESCDSCRALSEALGGVALEFESLEPMVVPEALVTRTIERVQSLDSQPQPRVFATLAGQLVQGWMALGKLLWMPFAAMSQLRGRRLAIALPVLSVLLVMGSFSVVVFHGMGANVEPMALNRPVMTPREPLADQDGQMGNRRSNELDDAEGLELDEWSGRVDGYVGGADFVPPEDPSGTAASPFETGVAAASGADGDSEGDLYWERQSGFQQNTGVVPPMVATETVTASADARLQPASDRVVPPTSVATRSLSQAEERREEGRFDRDISIADIESASDSANGDGEDRRAQDHRGDDESLWARNGEGSEELSQVLNGLGRDHVTELSFRPPTGRWSNTYVPGDPRWRLLARRLRRTGSGVLAGVDVSGYALAQQAQQNAPRIAAPSQSALALSVQSDRAQVEGQTRVLMQVGLRGAAVRGRRPTLRSVVVLDLRNSLAESGRAHVRNLLASISRARTSSDRIGIVVAGPHGGMLVEPGPLRLGEVTVALRRAFSAEGGEPLTLDAALASAIQAVSELTGADSPLGSGLVWLVTPGLDAAEARSLERVAHTGALAGVTTTTIGLSSDTDAEPLETVALAGHGRRWVIDHAPQQIVRQEIQAVSRVVARALRVNVRLAQGTRLVNVLGSRSLSELEAQRSAAAERAVDQQLATRLGIARDRERDDDGIQIVIPAFYADDTHTILLDLVVEGPGAVADVSVRYKDLLRLDNGESNERLVLPRGRAERGPRQRDVLRSWLAYELSVSLRRAAAQLSSSRPAALVELRRARERLESARASVGALASDRRLGQQSELCQRFESALNAGAAPGVMADSLRIASRRLVFGDPLSAGEGSPR
ncbi:MAG: hypothetical protein AB8H86_10630 [Polyangiales bacterium]